MSNELFNTIEQILSEKFGSDMVERVHDTMLVGIDEHAITLSNSASSQALLIFTVLGELSAYEKDRLAQCELLLKANAFFAATHGFTLSYEEKTGVILQGLVPWSALSEPEAVVALLENFTAVADLWAERCEALASSGANTPEAVALGEQQFV